MWIKFIGLSCFLFNLSIAHQHKALEAQLYEDLLYDYNKIPRPVKNSSEVLMVDVGASLIRIIDVDEKNQILTLMLWLELKWKDSRLQWKPERYGNIKVLHIPSDLLWTPDLVLYNNAAGDPDITIFTDALVTHTGQVYWSPPSIYKSFCAIDITWFPFDVQLCDMKFGAWSYTGYYLDLRQIDMTGNNQVTETEEMENGMDLSFFYKSAEWDLLSLRSARHSVLYASCCGPEKYVDITYYFKLRRKTLFYTSNLIIPCFLISFLTTFVFYLSHHKITFSISILVTLTVFFLVLIDIIPPTSLVIPMFGRYLITTMILVSLSTMVSVVTVNFRFRSGAAHEMSPWTRTIFLKCLPRLLFMERPEKNDRLTKRRQSLAASKSNENRVPQMFTETTQLFNSYNSMPQTRIDAAPQKRERFAKFKSKNRFQLERDISPSYDPYAKRSSFSMQMSDFTDQSLYTSLHLPNRRETIGITDLGVNYASSAHASNSLPHHHHCHNQQQNQKKQSKAESLKNTKEKINDLILMKLVQQVRLIAEYFRRQEEETDISDDWQYVAMVLDRLFLIIFSVLNFGTFLILLEAPTLHETVFPMNDTLPTKPLGHPNIV